MVPFEEDRPVLFIFAGFRGRTGYYELSPEVVTSLSCEGGVSRADARQNDRPVRRAQSLTPTRHGTGGMTKRQPVRAC